MEQNEAKPSFIIELEMITHSKPQLCKHFTDCYMGIDVLTGEPANQSHRRGRIFFFHFFKTFLPVHDYLFFIGF